MRPKWQVQVELNKAQARLATAANDTDVKAAQSDIAALLTELAAVTEAENAIQAHDNDPGETAERRSLVNRLGVGDFVAAAVEHRGLDGDAAELCDSYGMSRQGPSGGIMIPWSVIDRQMLRMNAAYTTTETGSGGAGPVDQRMFVGRLFGRSVAMQMGVRMESIVQRAKFPIITTGTAVGPIAQAAAAGAAVAAVVSQNEATAHKITGVFELSSEAYTEQMNLDPALTMDLVMAARAQMYNLIINGDGSTAGHPSGILAETTDPTNPGAVVTFGPAASAATSGVDGIHAVNEMEVGVLLGKDTYEKFSELYQTAGEFSALDRLAARCRGVEVSSFIPAMSGTIQKALLHSGPAGGMRSDSVAALFGGGVEIVRDPYSQASRGILLTAILLWDYHVIRSAAYTQLEFKLS